jgi:Nif-specific regulatory protein
VNLLHSFMDMSGGLIALLDEEDQTTTVVGAGWNEAEAREHFERLPEQAVGQIVVSGMPLVVRDVARSPLFAEWSELKAEDAAVVRSFVGVPIKGESRTIGTITIERVGSQSSPGTLDEDVRYLTMIANLVGQTVALQTMVERDRERLMEERNRLEQELEQKNAAKHEGISWIIGQSAAIREVTEKVQLVARCNLPVLLCGESGTGKELFARAIHEYSPRKEMPYIRLNCAALSESVLESELFGHDKGAFTGAIGMRKGRFEMADGGTLFLDEIGEISTTFQAKLLRVLQEGEFERVGGNHTIKVDVRLVTATNRNLEAAVISGDFRSDLYYRISVVPIFLPALRERREDIPLLAREFVKRFNKEHGVSLSISPRAMEVLTACEFPGNVRELESYVRRTAALTKNPVLQAEDFELSSKSSSAAMGKSMSRARAAGKGAMDLPALEPNGRAQAAAEPGNAEPDRGSSGEGDFSERERLVDAMERAGWVQAKAARLLGLTPRQMGYALRKQGIEIKRF